MLSQFVELVLMPIPGLLWQYRRSDVKPISAVVQVSPSS